MDEFSGAGDCQFNEGEENGTVASEKNDVIHNQMKKSGEKSDKESESNPIDAESVFNPPIFEMKCPCPEEKSCLPNAPISEFFKSVSNDETENKDGENMGEVAEASNHYACGNEKSYFDAFNCGKSQMECESSGVDNNVVDLFGWQDCKCNHHLLYGEDELALQGTRTWDENGEDSNDKKIQDSLNYGVCDSTHPYLGGLRLDELDDDSIFHIASCMEARSIKYGLSQSCERFQAMFDNEAYWKSRINMKWQKRYPAVRVSEDFNYEDACIEGEDCKRFWSDPDAHTHHFMYSCNVNGEVDVVHLMQNGKLLLSGDRNRNLNLIDLTKYNPASGVPTMAEMNDMLVLSNCTIHKGWIWSAASVDNHLMTGSWDTRIRVFDLNSDIKIFSAYKCKSAVLSLYAETNDIVASCFDKKVYFFDRRSNDLTTHVFHKQAVLSVTGNQDYIISGSEDKTISIYDRRAGRNFKTLQLDAYSLCLSFQDNQLWLGDKRGLIHLYDANQGMFNHVGSYNVGHKDKVTDILYTRGSIFTCSGDKTLKAHTPTQDPEEMRTFYVHNKELTKIDYSCGVLTSAGGDESIGIWLPKQWGRDSYHL